ncbi:hypothetical protein PHYBLDRAFT_64277 [Phycomyces blakesleeanus NRRL 1555(-)]|uniref:Fungal-specific transcription factor n=2 Tax=Phycomyces blakesleeanus TaxID=4837 RepID=A0A162UHY5_PHYB8|nr:hypothetical protein PHYBLDRAFT_64277 [Phycomyces blakesleeanus NRRL 1555(-)]OAD75353.1 hypothetical protein PHYBLDRAFT_64277 [Phycomyces blakesleeanus NRRL 1555(-)]|eukprot:XP_018293393.1 hypothetical protein PHYBLDRAFT_64277 [Phycomyces blakesleeanus NRRL 1555(-)]
MAQIILGPHNGISINGTRPRRPKTRKLLTTESKLTNEFQLVPMPIIHPIQILSLFPGEDWQIECTEGDQYNITLKNVDSMVKFLAVLDQWAQTTSLPQSIPSTNISVAKNSLQYNPAAFPYINFHSELYVKTAWKPTMEWANFDAMLLTLLDDCVHYYIDCMNHYYPVIPKQQLIQWYASLDDPASDPLALSIATFWVRHVLIHHPPAPLRHLNEKTIPDTVQAKLASLAREALSNCFDIPHTHHILALCLLNMTTVIPISQKALYHTVAVRMALALGISPLVWDQTAIYNDKNVLDNRLWWYLYQIDHFLHESGAISCSMLQPQSDNHEDLARLQRPGPCSLDELEEQTGVVVWSNVLKVWLLRRRLVLELERANMEDPVHLKHLLDKVVDAIGTWASELPAYLKPGAFLDTPGGPLAEQCYSISMERCTNLALLLHRFLPLDGTTLNPLQRQAIMMMIDGSIELISLRLAVLQFAPCQTWPGDLRRSVELLVQSLKYNDSAITARCKLGLMRALRILRSMAEVRWEDDICIEMIAKIEKIIIPSGTCSKGKLIMDSSPEIASRSIKISNNLYEGVMMFDRDLQPRAQYYNPTPTDGSGNFTFIEDPAQNFSAT